MSASTTTADWNAGAANLLLETLRVNGVTDAVISPGSRSTPLVLAASQRLSTTVILDERVAGFYALGKARQRGACALICTSGTAGAHYYPAVIEASQTRTPLIVLTADRPPELQDCGAPQTIRQDGLFGPHVRYSRTVPTPESASSLQATSNIVLRALSHAFGSPPGPVHINVPYRKPLWNPGATSPIAIEAGRLHRTTPEGTPSGLHAVAAALAKSERPVVYVGPHSPSGADSAALELGRSLSIPVLTELAPLTHDVGHLELLLRSQAVQEHLAPDLLLHVGHAPIGRQVLHWMQDLTATRIGLDPDGWTHSPSGPFELLWTGDVTGALRHLAATSRPKSQAWAGRWKDASSTVSAALEGAPEVLDERFVAATVSSVRSELHVASSMPIRDVAAFGRPKKPTYSRGANGIDGTISTALGLGATSVLLGDLALRHDIGGLAAAVELGAEMDIFCVDNSGGGIFHLLPITKHADVFERFFATPQSIDLSRLVMGAGAETIIIDSPSALREVVHSKPSGVRVVIIRVDRTGSVASRNETSLRAVQALEVEGVAWRR